MIFQQKNLVPSRDSFFIWFVSADISQFSRKTQIPFHSNKKNYFPNFVIWWLRPILMFLKSGLCHTTISLIRNCSQKWRVFRVALRFKPWAAGWEELIPALCYAAPWVSSYRQLLPYIVFWKWSHLIKLDIQELAGLIIHMVNMPTTILSKVEGCITQVVTRRPLVRILTHSRFSVFFNRASNQSYHNENCSSA